MFTFIKWTLNPKVDHDWSVIAYYWPFITISGQNNQTFDIPIVGGMYLNSQYGE